MRTRLDPFGWAANIGLVRYTGPEGAIRECRARAGSSSSTRRDKIGVGSSLRGRKNRCRLSTKAGSVHRLATSRLSSLWRRVVIAAVGGTVGRVGGRRDVSYETVRRAIEKTRRNSGERRSGAFRPVSFLSTEREVGARPIPLYFAARGSRTEPGRPRNRRRCSPSPGGPP